MEENKETVEEQVVDNPGTENKDDKQTTNKSEQQKPYKSFSTQEEFDRHSAGILNNAKIKAEKELLALLGLKLDEKDKLAKFKEAYDNTLSESEKRAKELETITAERNALKNEISEKDAIIEAIGKTGATYEDVGKIVKMAKGLVDENTTISQAIEIVTSMMKPKMPKGNPLKKTAEGVDEEVNPFKTDNLTEQGRLIKEDKEKARKLYEIAKGKKPMW